MLLNAMLLEAKNHVRIQKTKQQWCFLIDGEGTLPCLLSDLNGSLMYSSHGFNKRKTKVDSKIDS